MTTTTNHSSHLPWNMKLTLSPHRNQAKDPRRARLCVRRSHRQIRQLPAPRSFALLVQALDPVQQERQTSAPLSGGATWSTGHQRFEASLGVIERSLKYTCEVDGTQSEAPVRQAGVCRGIIVFEHRLTVGIRTRVGEGLVSIRCLVCNTSSIFLFSNLFQLQAGLV